MAHPGQQHLYRGTERGSQLAVRSMNTEVPSSTVVPPTPCISDRVPPAAPRLS